ncbi:MAG: translocation/assembly module TamB domain-containing protein [Firmicutes bacterium]|nr:translocation/assembly module TamB domain-containing protein [Bacillota bacterium]
MSKPLPRKSIGISLAFLLVLAFFFFGFTQLLFTWEAVPKTLEKAIQKGLAGSGVTVQIQEIAPGPGTSFNLKGIQVQFSEAGWARIAELKVNYSWTKLLANLADPAEAVTGIILVEPEVDVDLGKPAGLSVPGSQGSKLPFGRLSIRVVSGKLTLRLTAESSQVPEGLRPVVQGLGLNLTDRPVVLTEVDGDILFTGSGQVQLVLNTLPVGTYLSNLTFQGQYLPEKGWALKLWTDNAEITGFARLAKEYYPELDVRSGSFSATAYLSASPGFGRLRWSADLWLHRLGGNLDSLEASFSGLQGGMTITKDLVRIHSLRAAVDGDWLEISGAVQTTAPHALDLRIKGERVELARHRKLWGKYLPAQYGEGIAGHLDLNLTVGGTLAKPVLAGRVTLADAGVAVTAPVPVEITGIGGEISLAGDRIWTEGIHLSLAGENLELKGQVLLGASPYFDLSLTTQQVGLDRLVSWLYRHGLGSLVPQVLRAHSTQSLKGELAFTGTVLGHLESPLFAGSLLLADGELAGVPVERLAAEFDYVHNTLNFRRLDLTLPQGQHLSGSLQLDPTHKNYSGIIKYQNLDTGWWAQYLPDLPTELSKLSGKASGDLVIEGKLGAFSAASAAGSTRIEQVEYLGQRLRQVSTDWSWHQGSLEVRYAELVGEWGTVSGSGSFRPASGEIEAQVFGHNLALPKVVAALEASGIKVERMEGLGGTATFRAKLSGTLAAPQASGTVVVAGPAWRGESFDLLTGNLRYIDRNLVVEKVELTTGLARVALSGQINQVLTKPKLFLKINIEDVESAKLASLFGYDLPVSGLLDSRLELTGSLEKIRVKGPVSVAKGTIKDLPLESAQAEFFYQDGLVQFTDLFAVVAGSEVKANGRIDPEGVKVSFQVAGADLALLEQLGVDFPQVQGSVGFSGVLSGEPANLILEGRVEAKGLAYQGYHLARAEGFVQYYLAQDKVVLDALRLYPAKSSIQVTGEVYLASRPRYRLDAVIFQVKVEDGKKVAPDLPWPEVSGSVSGVLHLEGQGSDVSARAVLEVADLKYRDFRYDGALDLGYADGVFQLYQGRLWHGESLIVAEGTYQIGGDLDIDAQGHEFDLAPLVAAFRPDLLVEAQTEVELKLTGSPQAPRGTVKFALKDGVAEGVNIDSCEGLIQFGPSGIELKRVSIVTGANQTLIHGTLPYSYQEEGLGLQVQMEDKSLALLSLITDAPVEVDGRGRIDLTISGSLQKPVLNGVVDLDQLHLALPSVLPGSFDGVTAKIDFSGRRGTIKQATGFYNGGRFELNGGMDFTNPGAALLDLAFKGTGIGLDYTVLTSKADVDLKITGPMKKPLIKGAAVLTDAVFRFAQGDRGSKNYTSEARLDIKVTNSNDVRILVSDIVDVRAFGEITLGGTIKDLTLTGHAEATRGSITYADTEFRVTSGTADFASFRGVIPVLAVQAETRVPDALIQLRITGPADDLKLALESNPPMSEQEIVTRLSLPGRLSQLIEGAKEGMWEEELIRLFDEELSSQVMGSIESVVREALQLDEFRIKQAFSEENIQLQFGKYLVDNLYVTYTRTLDEENPLEYLGFEYRFKPNIILNNSISSDGEIRFGLETKLRF